MTKTSQAQKEVTQKQFESYVNKIVSKMIKDVNKNNKGEKISKKSWIYTPMRAGISKCLIDLGVKVKQWQNYFKPKNFWKWRIKE